MKNLVLILALVVAYPLIGQEEKVFVPSASTKSYLITFLSTDSYNSSVSPSFTAFLEKLEKKKSAIKKDKDFVRLLFSKTHQAYLKKYVPYTDFSTLFTDGSYNCLTGTILYATLLNHFQIPFEVTETNYHIFLTVETEEGKILIETTDPIDGFVDRPTEIEKRIASYKENSLTVSNTKATHHQFNFELYKSVSMQGLEGLLYYNKAVDSFNKQELEESINFLVKANTLYFSPRIEEFSALLLLAIQQSDWTDEEKERSLRVIYPISQKSSASVASLSSY